MKKYLVLAIAVFCIISVTVLASAATKEDYAKKSMTKEEYVQAFEAKAAAKGMTVEEFKTALKDKKSLESSKMTKEEFFAGLAAKGMTIEQYNALVFEKFEEAVAAKGMTVEEYKTVLAKKGK